MATSFAIDAASNMRSCLYRSGYDISLPLFPRTQFHYLADIPPSNRRFFLTTKVQERVESRAGRQTAAPHARPRAHSSKRSLRLEGGLELASRRNPDR